MVEKESLDIVCIATRPATHADMTVFAAERGVKGIYCEKPLCCSMAEADRMVDAVEAQGVKFNYGAQRRYAPLYRKMREIVDGGELGTVQAIIAEQGTSAALWGLTHGADMMLYLAGDPEVDFVQGTILCKDEDWDGNRLTVDPGVASGYVRFANGIHGYFTAAGGTEFEVSGTTGKIRSMSNGMAWSLRKQTDVAFEMAECEKPEVSFGAGTDRGILDLAQALDADGPTQCPIECARRSQEILMGIIASHRSGGQRIALPMANRSLYVGRENW
jgi:predicted dehydrogenase